MKKQGIKQYIKHKPTFVTIIYLHQSQIHSNNHAKLKDLRKCTNIDGGVTNSVVSILFSKFCSENRYCFFIKKKIAGGRGSIPRAATSEFSTA